MKMRMETELGKMTLPSLAILNTLYSIGLAHYFAMNQIGKTALLLKLPEMKRINKWMSLDFFEKFRVYNTLSII